MEILIEGRLVGGHPMNRNAVLDKLKQPAMQADGVTPATEAYVGIAIPKIAGTDWKQTNWGQKIMAAAVEGWKGGEAQSPTFAWKIIDGDSTIPNKRQKKPCDRVGYPGHWVLNCSTRLFVKCFHVGKYDPTMQIQNKEEIKPGDYCRVLVEAKANFPSESPGVYLNPALFELSRPGELIVLDSGPSAEETFGGGSPPGNTSAPGPGVEAAPDFLQNAGGAPGPEPDKYLIQGKAWTYDQLIASNWKPEAIGKLPKA